MRGIRLSPSRQRDEFVLAAALRDDLCHFKAALRKGSGLIKRYRVGTREYFHEIAAFYEHAGL